MRSHIGNDRKSPSPTATRESSKANPPNTARRPQSPQRSPLPSHKDGHEGGRASYFPGSVTPPAPLEPLKDSTPAMPSTPSTPSQAGSKPSSRRPGLLSRSSSEKLNSDGKGLPRRSSWISNISNKFSSSPGASAQVPTLPPQSNANGASSAAPNSATRAAAGGEEAEPYIPSRPKESSGFFSSLTRKLSAGQSGAAPRAQGRGAVCERRVLNVDPNRERCLVPEMDPSRLRKVSFCVDVEIAGGPKYRDDDDDDDRKKKKKRDVKLKERAEGEALKHPQSLKEDKDEKGETDLDSKSKPLPIPSEAVNGQRGPDDQITGDDASPPVGSVDSMGMSRKKEKKKRSEEERKERKEKRRRRAEENGSIPVELSVDNGGAGLPVGSPQTANGAPTSIPADPAKRDRPTTDPVRIYRRCCQLRETPILKRITEQLMSPTCCMPLESGLVHCLDLTGSRLQLADMVTLGDWLAVVPVKKLLLEDADLSDEGLRCILAGLLAATRPEPTRRRSPTPKHRQAVQIQPRRERSGVVEKLVLKNNPRITRVGWKHISLFLYMCRSLKAIDLSMIRFPDTIPASAHVTPVKSPQNAAKGTGQDMDAAETLYNCLSQRLGGNKLEELLVSECGLGALQIRKVVDGAIMCGIARLGFAGNNINDEGLDHILHYLRSGVCGGLDLGGNDLRDKLGAIADALSSQPGTPFWGLSLAGCNLNSASVKALIPALVRLPDFRFIDLSHNQDLCGQDNGTVSLLRRCIGQMKCLKRIHLADVGMSAKQAIALADVLPEGPQLAHINLLENPELTALASAKDESSQEEACALYASYMAAARVSNTLICVDIEVSCEKRGQEERVLNSVKVPSADNSEVVKALAKQVVAYSLHNMERFAIAEATGTPTLAIADATASLAQPQGGEKEVKEIAVPDVLMHLVGHVEGSSENHDNDEPAPDSDYIVGGTGVVKALQYVLGEKADDYRRSSIPTPSGTRTPSQRNGSSAGPMGEEEQRGKAKKMSKNLLDSARKIRARLQPALAKEAANGDEMAYRRLAFLDQTLLNMIQRFEEEYPETRLAPPSPHAASTTSSTDAPTIPSIKTSDIVNKSDDEDEFDEDYPFRPAISRHNSDVSLASRALAIEEGHLHRLGQRLRREVVDSPSNATALEDETSWSKEDEVARLKALQEKMEGISGPELKSLVEHDGWDSALRKVGANMIDLRILQEQDPKAWEDFKESQMKARMNLAQDARTN